MKHNATLLLAFFLGFMPPLLALEWLRVGSVASFIPLHFFVFCLFLVIPALAVSKE